MFCFESINLSFYFQQEIHGLILVTVLQDLTVILSTLLPVVCIGNDNKQQPDFPVGLKVESSAVLMCLYLYTSLLRNKVEYVTNANELSTRVRGSQSSNSN